MSTSENDWAQALAATIAAEREAMGLTQSEMLERTGMARSTYYKIEHGQRGVSATQLRVIARALGLTPGEMFDRADMLAIELPVRKSNAQKAHDHHIHRNPPTPDAEPEPDEDTPERDLA